MNIKESLYTFVKQHFDRFGYDFIMAKSAKKHAGHELVLPVATYAPWVQDKAFQKVYSIIKSSTLLDVYRCYELWQLVAEAQKVKGAFIEIGVLRGGSGALIASRMRGLGLKRTLYLCDTFDGIVKAGTRDTTFKNGDLVHDSVVSVKRLMHTVHVSNTVILKGIFPDQTQHRLKDRTFSFCHIDVDVYQSAKDIVAWVWPKLSVGGMLVFDDYGFHACSGITEYVNELRSKNDRVIIHNLNGHAIVIKTR